MVGGGEKEKSAAGSAAVDASFAYHHRRLLRSLHEKTNFLIEFLFGDFEE